MPYYTKEEIADVRKIDLLTYLQQNDPQQLIHISGDTWKTREHESLKISNGKWMWWSKGIGGASALDYLIKVKGISFMEAMGKLTNQKRESTPSQKPPQRLDDQKSRAASRLLLPDRAANNDRIIAYLTGRGIDREILEECIREGLLYESLPYHNCVFLGYDREGNARYASFRACKEERIMGEAAGSDKRFAFRIDRPGRTIHVFESAIDLLSFATIMKDATGSWRAEPMVSLGGVYAVTAGPHPSRLPAALVQALDDHADVNTISLHLDNDLAGKTASESIRAQLRGKYQVQIKPPREGKDCNEYLTDFYKKKTIETRKEDRNDDEPARQ